MRKPGNGFTLAEVVVSVSILTSIGILLAIGFPLSLAAANRAIVKTQAAALARSVLSDLEGQVRESGIPKNFSVSESSFSPIFRVEISQEPVPGFSPGNLVQVQARVSWNNGKEGGSCVEQRELASF